MFFQTSVFALIDPPRRKMSAKTHHLTLCRNIMMIVEKRKSTKHTQVAKQLISARKMSRRNCSIIPIRIHLYVHINSTAKSCITLWEMQRCKHTCFPKTHHYFFRKKVSWIHGITLFLRTFLKDLQKTYGNSVFRTCENPISTLLGHLDL